MACNHRRCPPGLAQGIEHQLPKLAVTGSTPVPSKQTANLPHDGPKVADVLDGPNNTDAIERFLKGIRPYAGVLFEALRIGRRTWLGMLRQWIAGTRPCGPLSSMNLPRRDLHDGGGMRGCLAVRGFASAGLAAEMAAGRRMTPSRKSDRAEPGTTCRRPPGPRGLKRHSAPERVIR